MGILIDLIMISTVIFIMIAVIAFISDLFFNIKICKKITKSAFFLVVISIIMILALAIIGCLIEEAFNIQVM